MVIGERVNFDAANENEIHVAYRFFQGNKAVSWAQTQKNEKVVNNMVSGYRE